MVELAQTANALSLRLKASPGLTEQVKLLAEMEEGVYRGHSRALTTRQPERVCEGRASPSRAWDPHPHRRFHSRYGGLRRGLSRLLNSLSTRRS